MTRWLITGCSTGIGRAIAVAALDAGHSVAVTARRCEAQYSGPFSGAAGKAVTRTAR